MLKLGQLAQCEWHITEIYSDISLHILSHYNELKHLFHSYNLQTWALIQSVKQLTNTSTKSYIKHIVMNLF